jgi:thiol-disulfide isomerase/thioredoxin
MKRLLVLMLLSMLLLVTGCDGRSRQSLPAEGQWRLVNYWALWCTPCREEIPELNLVDKAPDITVFGVNYDDQKGPKLSQQRSEMGILFANLPQDPASALGVPRPSVLPTTLIVSPEGNLVATLKGPQTAQSLKQLLIELGR